MFNAGFLASGLNVTLVGMSNFHVILTLFVFDFGHSSSSANNSENFNFFISGKYVSIV